MSLGWPESKGFGPLNFKGLYSWLTKINIPNNLQIPQRPSSYHCKLSLPHIFLDTSTTIEKLPRHAGRILPNGFPMSIVQSENITSTSTLAVRTLLPPTVGSIKIVRSTYRSVKWYWERHVRVVKKNIRILILKNNKQRWKIKLHVL